MPQRGKRFVTPATNNFANAPKGLPVGVMKTKRSTDNAGGVPPVHWK